MTSTKPTIPRDIAAYWQRGFDTADIAKQCHLPEHEVERWLNRYLDNKLMP